MEEFTVTGKITNTFFKSRVFPFTGHNRPEVMLGPRFGVDVSVVSLPNGLAMAMTSDPLSLIPTLGLRESAWLSVQLMANDMATTGMAPQYAQFVLNLPASLSSQDFTTYWKYIHEYCEKLGVAITGGHTGRFDGLNSTVSGGGTMITIGPADEMITSTGAQPGDVIIMTKECAMLSTAILALSFPETVRARCGDEIWRMGCELFYQTSAVEAGLVAGEVGKFTKGITAMHDVTEGGVMGALYEVAQASGCGMEIYEDKIVVGRAQREIGKLFDIDPKYCVGAGTMIITAKPDHWPLLLSMLQEKNIQAEIIGRVVPAHEGVMIQRKKSDEKTALVCPETDPYWNAFFNAFKNNWT